MRRGSRPSPREVVDCIEHFDGVSRGFGERLVHIGDDCAGLEAGAVGDCDQAFGQFARIRLLAMKAPEPILTSSTSALEPGGELLRQDRGGDQRHRFDRRRHIADRIEPLVGGRQIGGLADDGAAASLHALRNSALSGCDGIAGDRIELVERAAGMAEAAARIIGT